MWTAFQSSTIWKTSLTKVFEYLIIIYKAIDMFNFITSFKKDVKAFIANAEARFKALEDKIDNLFHDSKTVPETEEVKTVEAPKAD